MASYRVEVSRTAEKQLRRLERSQLTRVVRTLAALANEPRPPGCRKLAGTQDVWRVRVGMIRVIYAIEDRRLVVRVLKVGHRKDVYR